MNPFFSNFRFVAIVSMLLLMACGESLEERIVSTYPNGLPTQVIYHAKGNPDQVVKEVRFYDNGEKQEEGRFQEGQRHGKWVYWYPNGQKWSEGYFFDGERDGEARVWYDNGNLHYTGQYDKGVTAGEWLFYTPEGDKLKRVVYENGKKLSEESFEPKKKGFPAR